MNKEEIFNNHLKPLIEENYAKRRAGELPDEWFWADEIACEWGYFVTDEHIKKHKENQRLCTVLTKWTMEQWAKLTDNQ